MVDNPVLRVANITTSTKVNGPGERTAIHFQGCTLACAGCFNPEQWDPDKKDGVFEYTPYTLYRCIAARDLPVTFSGGEPFQQKSFITLLRYLHIHVPHLTVMAYTGYNLDEIDPLALGYIDALIAGRYENKNQAELGLRASENQVLHSLSRRITIEQLAACGRGVSARVDTTGLVNVTGFPSKDLIRKFKRIK